MAGNLGNTDTATWSPSQIAGMRGQTLAEYQDEQSAKKREEKREEYINSIDYNDTGGLPANLRYPYAMIDLSLIHI